MRSAPSISEPSRPWTTIWLTAPQSWVTYRTARATSSTICLRFSPWRTALRSISTPGAGAPGLLLQPDNLEEHHLPQRCREVCRGGQGARYAKAPREPGGGSSRAARLGRHQEANYARLQDDRSEGGARSHRGDGWQSAECESGREPHNLAPSRSAAHSSGLCRLESSMTRTSLRSLGTPPARPKSKTESGSSVIGRGGAKSPHDTSVSATCRRNCSWSACCIEPARTSPLRKANGSFRFPTR